MIIKRKYFSTSIEDIRRLKTMNDEELLEAKRKGLSPAATIGAAVGAGYGVSKGMKYLGKHGEQIGDKIIKSTMPDPENLIKSKGAKKLAAQAQARVGATGAMLANKFQGVSRKHRRLAGGAAAIATVAALRRSKKDNRYNETLDHLKEGAQHRDKRKWDREVGEARRYRADSED